MPGDSARGYPARMAVKNNRNGRSEETKSSKAIFFTQLLVNSAGIMNIMAKQMFYATKSIIFVKMLEEEVNAIQL